MLCINIQSVSPQNDSHLILFINIFTQNIMKKQQLNIRSCYNCQESCLTTDKTKHSKLEHQQLYSSILIQFIDQMPMSSSVAQFSTFTNLIVQILIGLKRSVDGLIELIESKKKQTIIKYGLGISNDSLVKKIGCLLSGERQKIKSIKCHDVHEIQMKLYEATPLSGFKMAENIESIGQKISQELNKGITEINQVISRVGTSKNQSTGNKNQEKIQTQRKTSQVYSECQQTQSNNDYKEARPYRVHNNLHKQQTRDYITVKDLERSPFTERFNIFLKVIKIVKTFSIYGKSKIQIIAGDQTGVANCVFDDIQSIIAVGNVLQVVSGRLYHFKDSILQIQDQRNTIIKVSDKRIPTVSRKFNLSERIEKKRKNSTRKDSDEPQKKYAKRNQSVRVDKKEKEERKQRKQQKQSEGQQEPGEEEEQQQPALKKIGDIEPGDEHISLKCQVYEIIDIDEKVIRCYIGDETGIVKIQLPEYFTIIKEGATVSIENVNTLVIDGHIIIKTNKRTQIRKLGQKEKLPKINISNDISEAEWEEDNT